jgi:two-component system sensor histidine kinase BaeS
MIFRSIRWRLVASYVVLTLLTVSLMGVLAFSLVRRYAAQQEQAYLQTNAEAIARQALPLVQPAVRHSALQELARTAAFLGNVRVRILDAQQQVMVDSGPQAETDQVVWFMRPGDIAIDTPGNPFGGTIMVMPFRGEIEGRLVEALPFPIDGLPHGEEFFVIRREEGPWGSRLIFSGHHRWDRLPTPPIEIEIKPETEPEVGAENLALDRVVVEPIGDGAAPISYVELSRDTNLATEALATTRQAILVAAGAATLIAVIMGLLVSRGLTAPIAELTVAAGHMSGDLSTRAHVRGNDEIGQLAQQFNRMAERLEASFAELSTERDALRRFIADASHELRTPITALKAFNELLQNDTNTAPATRQEFLAESQIQLNRLEWITHNLLDLSRLDAGLIALDTAGHDVADMLTSAAAGFKALAEEKRIRLAVQLPTSPLVVMCDRARIEMALRNLLDNALKFTSAGGHVEIGAESSNESARLWVQDSGPGIDPADVPHIFKRFYRGRTSRADGSGLGLAIVQSVVQAHGGRVQVESSLGIGSRFVIEMPANC